MRQRGSCTEYISAGMRWRFFVRSLATNGLRQPGLS